MRPEPNKEIDLLLRQLARRDGARVLEIEEQHLDADELNSYVANALPAPARTRYTEHLADCSSCRKIVAQLSVAQGPIAERQSAAVVAPSRLKSFLASLFSPMVLRYAVPALGLIVIAVVGIFVFQKNQKGADVAKLTDTAQKESVLQSPTPEGLIAADKPVANNQPAQTGAVARATKDTPAPVVANQQPVDAVATGAEPPPPAPRAAPTEADAQPKPEAPKEKKAETAESPAAEVDAVKQRADDAARSRAQKLDESVAVPGTSIARREIRPAKRPEGTGTGSVANAAPTATAGRDDNKSRDKEREETRITTFGSATRSVAGRRFRKNGDVWIDTAYNSSAEVTNVTRGSEQYRALVADEPSIRTIAEELDGQIIVVWKGRTYRIR